MKVTRRPVATPAWRVARRVLERERRDDRRRGGRIDDGGGVLELRGKKKSRRGGKQPSEREGMEENRGSGSEIESTEGEGYRGDDVPTAPLRPRIKN